MKIKKEFVSNYLTKAHYSYGVVAAMSMLTLCLVFSLFYWDYTREITNYLSANYKNVFLEKDYWRLFTTTLVHANLKHLLSNSLMLYLLTYFVSSFYGGFISIGVSLVMAMVTNGIVLNIYGGEITLVGASGVVYYLWGFWLVLYILLERHLSLAGRLLRVGAVFMVLLIPTEYSPSTSYLAHYVGFLLGVFVGAGYFMVRRRRLFSYERWRLRWERDELDLLDEVALGIERD